MVDYSKWNNIDLSDDDSDCHPNIERNTWLRLKKEKKQRDQEEAEAAKAREDAKNADNIKRVAEIEEKLRAGEDPKLREEHKKLTASIEAHRAKRAKEEELAKKYPKWDDSTICRDGFSKTIVNAPASKPSSTASSASASSTTATSASGKATVTTTETIHTPSSKTVPQTIKEPTRLGKASFVGLSDDAIVALENKGQHFSQLASYDDMYRFIGEHPDIISTEMNTYLLLHTSDCLKRDKDAKSKKYLKASCVVQYCKELGRDGIALFFARMRDPEPKYRNEFERETMAYWTRIKEKVPELKAASQEDMVEQEDGEEEYEVLGEISPDAIPQTEETVPVADVD